MPPVVILSPHLDDAVFSCWHVLTSTRDVLTLNVFTAAPEPGTEPAPWDRMTGADDAVARMSVRLAEDNAALALAGRNAQHLDFLDSQYREAPPAGLQRAMQEHLPPEAHILAPAAIGGHPDHELVRDVALKLETEARRVTLYADIPYATEFGWPDWLGAEPDPFRNVDAYWARFVPAGYDAQPVELSEADQRTKIGAMQMYRSQFGMLEAKGQRRLTLPELVRFEFTWTKAGKVTR
jgi:LmbE family N-acetylglucosaminyl deacetylase